MTGESTKAAEDDFDEIKFQLPSWAGKPPSGMHLDVGKGERLVQKLMIDEKRCYYFGRNPKQCDFSIDHASCSRVHAVLVYHKHLTRFFLIDLGSTHGTYIGKVRLEAEKPEHVQIDQSFHFGASTRRYTLRSRLKAIKSNEDDDELISDPEARLRNLPEKEEELANLTEYNTALNRRIAAMNVGPEDDYKTFRKRKTKAVAFLDEEQIINPEDIDPSVGRFRNLVHTAVIPNKRQRLDAMPDSFQVHAAPHLPSSSVQRQAVSRPLAGGHLTGFGPVSAKLGLAMPNPAPDIDLYHPQLPAPGLGVDFGHSFADAETAPSDDEPRKKKYAKEAWPGKKPGSHLLVP